MPLTLESASLVRQKVYAALEAVNNETANHKLWWTAARELFNALYKSGVDKLQFIPFSAGDAVTAGTGVDTGVDAAHQIYMVYAKKRATATDTFLRIADDAEADSISSNQATILLAFLESGDEAAAVYPEGLVMANGLVINAVTAADGDTESAEADAPDGFVVVGS